MKDWKAIIRKERSFVLSVILKHKIFNNNAVGIADYSLDNSDIILTMEGGKLRYLNLDVFVRWINICGKFHYGLSKKCRDLCKLFSHRIEGESITNINGELTEWMKISSHYLQINVSGRSGCIIKIQGSAYEERQCLALLRETENTGRQFRKLTALKGNTHI
jgi:hypothetical protein